MCKHLHKKSHFLLIVLILILSGFFVWHFSLAYEPYPTHKSLAEKSARLYNDTYQASLTEEDIQQIFQGAIQEDTAPRWINHFYDPTTGQGWNGERMGDLDSDTVRRLSLIALSDEKAVSSVQWAHDQKLQDKYLRYGGNQTLERAVYLYVNGKQKEAYLALGHILHLIEDLTVPAHTRQDSHWDMVPGDPGEPYERWLKANTFLGHLNDLNPEQENFSCQNLDDCFIQVAEYSNENFFSEDTILDQNYPMSFSIDYIKDGIYYYAFRNDNGDFLFRFEQDENGNSKNFTVSDPKIHSLYWQHLSKKSVLAGIEILRIFHETVEKAKHDQSIVKPAPPSSALWYLRNLPAGMIGAIMSQPVPKPISSPGGMCYEIYNWVKENIDEHWDNDAPETYARSTSFVADATVDFDYVEFEFYSIEENSTFECQLDGGGFQLCTSPKEYPSLTNGIQHTFEVRAVDGAGNKDGSPATITWTIISPEPSPQPFSLFEAEETTATSVKLRWESSFPDDYIGEYRIVRSLDLEFSVPTTIATTSETAYFDQALHSETQYYYKIIACNSINICLASENIISIITPEFSFFWFDPQMISTATTTRSTMPSIVIGPDGLLAASWYTMFSPGYLTLTFSQKIDFQNWLAPQYLYDSGTRPYYSTNILNGPQGFEIFYSGSPANFSHPGYDIVLVKQIDDVWQSPQKIISDNNYNYNPVAAVDKSGITHLIWRGKDVISSLPVIFYLSFDPFGVPLGGVEQIPGSFYPDSLNFIIDEDNKLHAVWYNYNDWDIYYSRNNRNGSGWQATRKIFITNNEISGITGGRPQIVSDKRNHFFIAWPEMWSEIRVAEFDGIATSTTTIFPYSGYPVAPRLILSQTKKLYLFLAMSNSMYFTLLGGDGQWESVQMAFVFNYGLPLGLSMIVDTNNILHVAWETRPISPYRASYIYYTWGRIE